MILNCAAILRRHPLPHLSPHVLSLCLSVLFIISFGDQVISAQSPEVLGDEVIRVNTDLVTVPVVVTDKRGRRVHGLGPGDFAVRDEGRSVEVAYFAAGSERVALAFLLDASGSARDIITQQRETAAALFSRFGRTSRVAVFHFRDRLELIAPFANNIASANGAFSFPLRPGRSTAIFDAALGVTRAFRANPSGSQPERRIVIMISDGLDTASVVRPSTVIEEARLLSISFYVIHLPLFTPRAGRLVPRPTSKGFRTLAEQTGGRFFTVGDARSALVPHARHDLEPVFRAITEDLQGQYMLGYYLGNAARDQSARRIEVRLAPSHDDRRLRVRTLRESYTLNDN